MLQMLLNFDKIAIQCHNIPDADSIASGFGLFSYFKSCGKSVLLFYAGPKIVKPNLVSMIEQLQIPIMHEPDMPYYDGLLITVDCQYGMGNVKKIEAKEIAVIDHHIQESTLPELCDLRPWLGSCSTLVWDLLTYQNFNIDTKLGTALLYGLFMDTNGFSELNHPLDRDMWEALIIDEHIFKLLKLSNFSMDDLIHTSTSLTNLYVLCENLRTVIIPAPPCDPNILGVISDFALQVDGVDTVIAFSVLPDNNVKFSVRTATINTKANDLAKWLASDFGSGGGHKEKAGGYIVFEKLKSIDKDISFHKYCEIRLTEYYEKFQILDCLKPESYEKWKNGHILDKYRKRQIAIGYVNTVDIFGENIDLHVRTLEGDIQFKSHIDKFLMIGITGEVYPIERKVFDSNYESFMEPFKADFQYPPSIHNINTGRRISLLSQAFTCYSKDVSVVKARRLEADQYLKIFTSWDRENYYSGNPYDWFVYRECNDFYIVNKDIFDKIYIRDFTDEDISQNHNVVQAQSSGNEKVFALNYGKDFTLLNKDDNKLLQGTAKSWLVQYKENKYEILSSAEFEAKFKIV